MMRLLEDRAIAEYAEHGPGGAKEFVALGFEIDDGADSIVWYRLTNSADGAGEFLVESDEVKAVLSAFQNSPENALLMSIVLWHSHYITVEPSEADVEHFPEWVNTGMVFHAPSGTTTLYNAAGIILNSDIQDAARDTQEVTNV
ncbi:hypothetical protein SEA_NARUTORUN_3 [Microbacterium phage NarutoRun]|uniref:Uncharacterized protein n=2 Tax=Krampusvirus krampus TaxID=2734242 RepID=A0A4Y6EJ82_9CAUD|nr:hypothetical protein SEA_ANAKIN_3 [Microbacterium phage Anakin]QDF18137.1 hypothetical protein SEA_NARUTORUN_3 [Microbacterium phage NarutoRun]